MERCFSYSLVIWYYRIHVRWWWCLLCEYNHPKLHLRIKCKNGYWIHFFVKKTRKFMRKWRRKILTNFYYLTFFSSFFLKMLFCFSLIRYGSIDAVRLCLHEWRGDRKQQQQKLINNLLWVNKLKCLQQALFIEFFVFFFQFYDQFLFGCLRTKRKNLIRSQSIFHSCSDYKWILKWIIQTSKHR